MDNSNIVEAFDDHLDPNFQFYYSGNFNLCQLSPTHLIPFVCVYFWHHGITNTAYGKQRISWRVWLVAPIPLQFGKLRRRKRRRKRTPVTCQLSCVTCQVSLITCCVPPVTFHMSHVTNINSHIQGPSPCYLLHNSQ